MAAGRNAISLTGSSVTQQWQLGFVLYLKRERGPWTQSRQRSVDPGRALRALGGRSVRGHRGGFDQTGVLETWPWLQRGGGRWGREGSRGPLRAEENLSGPGEKGRGSLGMTSAKREEGGGSGGDENGPGWWQLGRGMGRGCGTGPPSFCMGHLSGLCRSLRWGLDESWAWSIRCSQEICLDGVVFSFQMFLRSRSISSKRTSEPDMQNRGVVPPAGPAHRCPVEPRASLRGEGQLCGPGNLTSTCYS